LDTRAAVRQWAASYKRATWLQAPLALLGFLGGATAWLMGAGAAWLVAAVLIGAVVPFTFIVVMPTNHELLAPGRDLDAAETRMLLRRWGRLHAVRSALGVAAATLDLWFLRASRRRTPTEDRGGVDRRRQRSAHAPTTRGHAPRLSGCRP